MADNFPAVQFNDQTFEDKLDCSPEGLHVLQRMMTLLVKQLLGRGANPLLVDVCLVQMVAFKAQELANCLWGFASMGVYPGDEFLRALSQEARSRPGAEFSASNVAQMLWGFAALSYEPDLAALEFFSAQIEARLPEFSAQGLSMVLWSYARLGTGPDRQTLDALVGQCDVGRMNLQDLTNIMWSLVVMRHYSPAGTAFICEAWEALEGYAPGAFSTAAL